MMVSVVVTVYNLRELAPRAIASALNQTRQPLEVIVVDDGSTDGSADVLESAFGDRIRLVRLPRNEGVLRATLAGIACAKGAIVCFLDGDDTWEPRKIERVAAAFERDPSVILVSHDYRQVDADDRALRVDDPLLVPTRALAQGGDADALSAFMRASVLEYGGHVWLGSAYSIRLDALDLGAFSSWIDTLPDPRLVYQDHPLATFLLVHSEGRASYVDEKLFHYRIHDANYSSASLDLGRARSIAQKALATRRATHAIVASAGARFGNARAIQAARIRECEFLTTLYDGEYGAAVRAFGACARSVWSSRQTLKELVRLGTVVTVGPERFIALKRARRPGRRGHIARP